MKSLSMRLENLSFAYESNPLLFKNLSFEFPDLSIVRLCSTQRGKSTLLKILAGLLHPTDGAYFVGEQNIAEMSFEEFLPLRMKIGFGFDMGGLINNKTILENVLLPLEYHKELYVEDSILRVHQLLAKFDLDGVKHQRPFAVSGSQRKACCLIRAFIHRPEIVILDEPDSGLKDRGVNSLCEMIENAMENYGLKKVIYTSENLTLSERLGAQEVWIERDMQLRGAA